MLDDEFGSSSLLSCFLLSGQFARAMEYLDSETVVHVKF